MQRWKMVLTSRGRKIIQMRQIYLEMVWQEERKIGYRER
jgi:hypothetical protein